MAAAEPLIASVDLWPLDWAPRGWVICSGQMLAVNQYTALYALLGTRYGGNGQTTFGVPDMRGRVPVGVGQGVYQGASNYVLAQIGGLEQITLIAAQAPLAAHTHTTAVTDPVFAATATSSDKPGAHDGARGVVTSNTPVNNFPVALAAGVNNYATTSNANMGASSISVTVTLSKTSPGSVVVNPNGAAAAQAHENRMPFIALNYILATEGIYPSRP